MKSYLNGEWKSSTAIPNFTPEISYTEYIEGEFMIFQKKILKMLEYLDNRGYSKYNNIIIINNLK